MVLPTYNEKQNVLLLLQEIHKHLAAWQHEIILVDDNSPDGTYEAVSGLGLPYVKAFVRTTDRGLANSIRHGLENSQGEVVVVMDSDFNHDPEYLPFMLESLEYYDCVVASRFLYGGSMDSRIRHLASWLFNIFVRLSTGGQISDNLYGYFAVKRSVLAQCEYDRIFWGYGDYYFRLLYFLQKEQIRILQFPAVNGRRLYGKGQSNLVGILFQYSRELLKLAVKGGIRHVH